MWFSLRGLGLNSGKGEIEMPCRVCNRKLSPKHEAEGIGPVCKQKELAGRDGKQRAAKINFLSHPRTTAADVRSWLYRSGGDRFTIRVFPGKGTKRTATCDCGSDHLCEHLAAVAPVDKEKFYPQKTTMKYYRNELFSVEQNKPGALSLRDVARFADVSVNTLQSCLNGTCKKLDSLEKVSKYYKVPFADLFYDPATTPAAMLDTMRRMTGEPNALFMCPHCLADLPGDHMADCHLEAKKGGSK